MQYSITYTDEDILQYCKDCQRCSYQTTKGFSWNRFVGYCRYYMLFFSVPVVTFGILSQLPFNGTFLALCFVLVTVAWSTVYSTVWRRFYLWRVLKKTPWFTNAQTIVLDESGVTNGNADFKYTIFWGTIVDIVLTSHNILFYAKNSQKANVFPLPRRILTSPDEADQVFKRATEWWSAAKAAEGNLSE